MSKDFFKLREELTEDAEQIDELSNETLKSYGQAAAKSARDPKTKNRAKRIRGAEMAADKIAARK